MGKGKPEGEAVRLDHIGIAVRRIEEAKGFFSSMLDVPISDTEALPSRGVSVAFLDFEGLRIELIEPLGSDSPIAGFLEKRGQGMHHLCFLVPELGSFLEKLKAQGCRLIDEKPRAGAGGSMTAFVHPSSSAGVLVEFKESGS